MSKTTEDNPLPPLEDDWAGDWTPVIRRSVRIPEFVRRHSGPAGAISGDEVDVHYVNEVHEEENARRVIHPSPGAETARQWLASIRVYGEEHEILGLDEEVRFYWHHRFGDNFNAHLPPYLWIASLGGWLDRNVIRWDRGYMPNHPEMAGVAEVKVDGSWYRIIVFVDEQ